jgi:transposase-like protein
VRGTKLFPVKGGAVVYDPVAKRLFALNYTAAFVWQSFNDGLSPHETISELAGAFGISKAKAARWLTRVENDLRGEPPTAMDLPENVVAAPQPDIHDAGVDYLLLDQTVRIDAPPEALGLIDSMLVALRQPAKSHSAPVLALTIVRDGETYRIFGQSGGSSEMTANQLVSGVETAIVETIVPKTPHFLAFHAALLSKLGRSVLLPARSGSGKSTLSVALAAGGWTYHTDEMVLLDRELLMRGLPLPPCIKTGNYDLVAHLDPSIKTAPEHQRFGRNVRFVPTAAADSRVPVKTIVFPRYHTSGDTMIEEIDPLAGLQRLLELCVYVPPGLAEEDILGLINWHKRVRYLSLSFGNVHGAVACLDAETFV